MRQDIGSEGSRGEHTTILLIYDTDGNLVAETDRSSESGARPEEPVMPGSSNGVHYAETFGRDSDLTTWLAKQIDQAKAHESYTAESRLEYLGGRVRVRFETLRFPAGDTPREDFSGKSISNDAKRYAVLISPSEDRIPEGASLITRQQWHDIKNHLGGLKLYATFLKKKIPDGEDQAIVEKLLNGINGLIEHLAQIRGGDAK